jgi:hypothetical protein
MLDSQGLPSGVTPTAPPVLRAQSVGLEVHGIRYDTVMVARIRPEAAQDAGATEAVTIEAFAASVHGNHGEHLMVAALRKAGALILSLVAELDARVRGPSPSRRCGSRTELKVGSGSVPFAAGS